MSRLYSLEELHQTYQPREGFTDLRDFALPPAVFWRCQEAQEIVWSYYDAYGTDRPAFPLLVPWERVMELAAWINIIVFRYPEANNRGNNTQTSEV